MKLGNNMNHELRNQKIHINFIQTALFTGLTSAITGQLKSLIVTAVKDRTGKFLKDQFKQRATVILKEWLITQLRGKFIDYLTDFIVTYIESNSEKIFENKVITKTAEVIINNIVKGLGTFLLNK
jgi:hypothetical protein